MAVIDFKAVSRDTPEMPEEDIHNRQSGLHVTRPRFEPHTSQIQMRYFAACPNFLKE
jgi:hypothetical protein